MRPDADFLPLRARVIGEVGKLLGAKWKELDESEKKPYVEQAAQDKQRAEQEKAEYDVCLLALSHLPTLRPRPYYGHFGFGF